MEVQGEEEQSVWTSIGLNSWQDTLQMMKAVSRLIQYGNYVIPSSGEVSTTTI